MTKVLEPIIKYYNKDIYYPSDDSYLILDYFKEKVVDNKIYKKLKQNVNYILDMGTGLGLFAIFFAMFARSDKFFNPKIYACDILEKALIYAQKNATFNQVEHDILFVLSDLFKNFSSDLKGKFDIIIFNPPYLPSLPILKSKQKKIDKAWNGGKFGFETTIDFLKQAKDYLSPNILSQIYYITSSYIDLSKFYNKVADLGFKNEIIDKKHIFFEDIILNKAKLL